MEARDFNENWIFSSDSCNMLSAGAGEGVEVTLPHDAMIREKRDEDHLSKGPGGYYPGGRYSYKKRFVLPKEDEDKTVIFEVEGAYRRSRVYLNGALLNSCTNGYRGFFTDLTPYLKRNAENELEVKVENDQMPNSRWYTGSGIYRPVRLLLGGPAYIGPDSVKITTPCVGQNSTAVVTFPLISKRGGCYQVCTAILDESGKECAFDKSKITVMGSNETAVYQRICIKESKLWSTEHPHLYCCRIEIKENDAVIDRVETEFGIRDVQVDPACGLRVNGESVLLRGACIHHDNGIIGAVTTLSVEKRRVRLLKEAGFNAIRMSHNSASKALLTACDQVGMLLMEEVFDAWNNSKVEHDDACSFLENWEADVEAVVRKDFNHPCVIMYSIGNEIQELGTAQGAEWNRRIADKFRRLDPTRLVTNAVNGLVAVMGELPQIIRDMNADSNASLDSTDINAVMTALMGSGNELSAHPLLAQRLDEVFDALDVCGYNYMRGRYEPDAANYPNRIIVGTETYGPDIDLNWELVKKHPQVIGDFTWTGWDYIGEAGIGVAGYGEAGGFLSVFPTFLAYVGDIDITGRRRPISYYREIVWGLRKTPYIAVQPPAHYGVEAMKTPWVSDEAVASWTWDGEEGRRCIVEVYSDAPEVELFLNGESAGRKHAGKENRFKSFFDVAFTPGQLKCVAYYADGTEEIATLTTAGQAVGIELKTYQDIKEIATGEIIHLECCLTDQEGRLNTAETVQLKAELEGPAEIMGFGSGNPKGLDDFVTDDCTTWNGKAVLAIRGTEAGVIKVKVKGKNLESEWREIVVREAFHK